MGGGARWYTGPRYQDEPNGYIMVPSPGVMRMGSAGELAKRMAIARGQGLGFMLRQATDIRMGPSVAGRCAR